MDDTRRRTLVWGWQSTKFTKSILSNYYYKTNVESFSLDDLYIKKVHISGLRNQHCEVWWHIYRLQTFDESSIASVAFYSSQLGLIVRNLNERNFKKISDHFILVGVSIKAVSIN